jgi:TonB-linked SusC/RagA family outer membrane protein
MKKNNLFLISVLFVLCISSYGYSQNRTITGTILSSEDKEPIPGVVVKPKGSTAGKATDVNGVYSIEISPDVKVLVFSMTGFANQEIEIGDKSAIDVTLQSDNKMLDELVVTAIGIKKEKKALGYSVQDVGGDQITKTNSANMIGNLGGKIAGVQVINSSGSPGGSAHVKLRGATSITGDNQPLIVVDGVPFNNTENNNNTLAGVAQSNRGIDINPDDIESITVLKGPAAAALYGTNASNGALIITTKKGSKATEGKKVNVVYSSSIALERVTNLPSIQFSYTQGLNGKYIDPSSSAIVTPYSWGAKADTLFWDLDPTYKFDIHGKIVGKSNPSTSKTPFVPYNNLKNFFQTGLTYDNSIALSGGNEEGGFRLSASNLVQTGIVPLSSFKRTTVKMSGDYKLSNKFKVSASIAYTNSGGRRVQQGSNISGLMLGLARTPISFDNSNGKNDPEDPAAYVFADGKQRTYRGTGGYDNPYFTINKNVFRDNVNRTFGFSQLDYSPLNWLTITYRLGTDLYSDRRKQYFAITSALAPTGQLFEEQYYYQHVNSDLMAIANKSFGKNFNTTLILGNNLYSQYSQRLYAQGDGFNFPDFYHMSNVKSYNSSESQSRRRLIGNFVDIKIDYKSMLYLDVTGRQESSSTLPVKNNTYFYPSASLGFIFTEALKINNKILPFGKGRVSYAIVGKDASAYSLDKYYSKSVVGDGFTTGITFPFNGIAGFTTDASLGNAAIQPERTSSFEAGFDLRFLSNKIALDFTYYNTKSINQIIPVSIAPGSGYTSMVMNSGSIENKGFEIAVSATPVKIKNFEWKMMINWSRNRSKVISLAEGVERLGLGGFAGTSISALTGKPYGQIYGGTWLKDEWGNVLIDDNKSSVNYGKPIADPTLKAIGDVNPDWLSGITNSFTYKRISASALIDIRQGGDIWNGTKATLTSMGTSKLSERRGETKVFEGKKQSTGEKNDIQTTLDEAWFTGNGGGFGPVGEQFVEDGSFIRLREVTLSYNLNPAFLKKAHISSLDISLFARNLWIHTKYDGVDPETSLVGSDSNAQGMDYFNMPGTRSYGAKLRIGF